MTPQRYLLYDSQSEGSLTFVPAVHMDQASLLPVDARLIWQVEAKSWEIACMKKHEYLGWEPYKPLIANPEDLRKFIPEHKNDSDNFQLLKNLGYPAIEPVLPELFEWIQDMNWPVAREIAPFLAALGLSVLPHVEKIFAGTDGIWKYWVINSVLNNMDTAEARVFLPAVRKLLAHLTEDDQTEEVDEMAKQFLERFQN